MNQEENYKKSIEVFSSSKKVFTALTNNLDLWWSKTSEACFAVNGHFTITFENGYWWTFKIIEYVPNSKLTWKCIAGEPEFNKEWIGNTLHWEIINDKTKTKINFVHIGLTPKANCYTICSSTWDRFIVENLKKHLETN